MGTLKSQDGSNANVILPVRIPEFDKMRKGNVLVAVVENVPRFYTGLQVNRDPGVWIVYCGFILMIIGCYITFFMSHQRICIEVTQSGKKSRVTVSGTSNKNKVGMRTRIRKLSRKLASDGQVTFHNEDEI